MRWFTKKELKSIDDFITKHAIELDCYVNNNSNHVNDGYVIELCHTGIGTQINVTCKCCGEKKDITDYDAW